MSTSMETQYTTALHDAFYAHPHPFPLPSDPYLHSSGDLDFASSFLGGSSLSYPDPHEPYPYVFNRGVSSSYRPSDAAATVAGGAGGGGLGATGLGFSAENSSHPGAAAPNNLFPAEELALCTGQPWSWAQAQASSLHGVVAPVPVLPSPPEASFLPLKIKQGSPRASFARSGDPPLPTPAAMVLLASSRGDVQGAVYDAAVGGQVLSARGGMGVATSHGIHETTCREKKHACTMCHKRFDRPSTLRKHLLVHTGEKAFVCDICGRRFGVASNLNRHVKRCALKPVNMTACSPPKSSSSASPPSMDETSPQPSPVAQSPEYSFNHSPNIAHKRGSVSSVSSSSSSSRGRSSLSPLQSNLSIPGHPGAPPMPTQKRRRRAPSPSRWVPSSLLSFNLSSEDMHRTVCVPLSPVRRNLPKEERDSWDENTAPRPYHPDLWKGVLPGPGLPSHQIGMRSKDLGKTHFGGGAGTFMVSRILVV